MVRLPLLLEHGGVWMDAGMILFRHLDDICWKKIEDPDSPYELAGFVLACYKNDDLAMANGFFAAKSKNPFLQRIYEVYRALWDGGAVNSDGFHKHSLLRHLGVLGAPNKVGQKSCIFYYRWLLTYVYRTSRSCPKISAP